jgi:flagellar biogenesis protein FliO
MQAILVVITILLAIAYLIYRIRGQFSRKVKKGCEKCGLKTSI